MSRSLFSTARGHALLGAAALLVGLLLKLSHPAPPDPTSRDHGVAAILDPAERLPGTWLREHPIEGQRATVRRILRLEQGGAFREQVRIVHESGAVTVHDHAGTWLYDGTNLKRRYTVMNGRPPSRLKLPFATFEIRFESKNEFVGVDHIHRNKIRYERVPPETEL